MSEADLTLVLQKIGQGNQEAVAELFPLVYQELRRKAGALMGQERSDHTLQPTALVNEAFVKMAGGEAANWQSRRHFYNAAADAMRKILVDHARRKASHKRGGDRGQVSLDGLDIGDTSAPAVDLDALDAALTKLQALDARRYQVVMYRYFAGLEEQEIAQLLSVALKTVQRDWKTAKLFLAAEMER